MKKLLLSTLVVLMLVSVGLVSGQDEPSLTIWADEIRAPVLQDLAPDFLDEYGVQLEIQQIQFSDIRGQFITSASSDEGPDIILGAHDWVGELAASGLITPVDLAGLEDLFAPAALSGFTFDGELYGLPYTIENVALFRNVDLVPEAPETWDEVREVSAQLVENGDAEIGFAVYRRDAFHTYPVMTAFGGYIFGFEEGVGFDSSDVGLDSDGTIAAYSWLGELIADELSAPGLDQETTWTLFGNGEAAMFITGSWSIPTIQEAGINYGISPIPAGPAGPGRPFLGMSGFMVSAFADDPQLAQIFLTEFIATDITMEALFEADPRPPAYLPLQESLEDPDIAAFLAAGVDGQAMPNIPEMGAVWESWANAIELTLLDPAIAESEFGNAAEQVRGAIAGEGEEAAE